MGFGFQLWSRFILRRHLLDLHQSTRFRRHALVVRWLLHTLPVRVYGAIFGFGRIFCKTFWLFNLNNPRILGFVRLDSWLDFYWLSLAHFGLFASATQSVGRLHADYRRLWRFGDNCVFGGFNRGLVRHFTEFNLEAQRHRRVHLDCGRRRHFKGHRMDFADW